MQRTFNAAYLCDTLLNKDKKDVMENMIGTTLRRLGYQ
jgi:hypothetical protein